MNGWSAAASTWRGASGSGLSDTYVWASWEDRLRRYNMYSLYYENQQYNALNAAVLHLRREGKLYTNIRGVYNPVSRLINVYSSKIYPGAIDLVGLNTGALPVVADDRLTGALLQLFRWSNWNSGKMTYVRNGEKYGDTFIKVVDDPEGRRVVLEVLDAHKVKYLAKDAAGNIKECWIEYRDIDDDRPALHNKAKPSVTTYVHTEIITGETVTIYRDGVQVDQYDNPFGFVPVVHAQAQDEGRGYGDVRWAAARGKIDEINSQAALINDAARRAVTPLWVTRGFKLAADSFAHSETSMDELVSVGVSVGHDVQVVSPTLNIADALTNLERQLVELEQDLPELSLYKIQEAGGSPSGVALRQLFDLPLSAITSAAGQYDDATIRACQMAITMGGVGRYPGFEAFNINSYDRGDLDFTIRARPLLADGLTERERMDFLLASGAPQTAIWTNLGVEATDQVAWTEILAETANPSPTINRLADDASLDVVTDEVETLAGGG